MHSLAFWFQSPDTWPAAVLVGAAASLLGLTGVIVVQLRRQVQAAWAETGRIYQRSSARFSSVGDLLEGVLFETDATRTLTYTNQAFHALTGFRERDLRSGLTLHDLFEPDERQRLLEDLETESDSREVRVRSYHLRRRDGAAVPVSLRMTAITDPEGLVGWRGLVAPVPETDDETHGDPRHRAGEQLLGGILREFNETPAEEHEAVLARGLAEIGRILGADRCYHYHASRDGESLVSLRQWYAPGVSPMSGDQRAPGLDQYPWSLAQLRDNGALVIADVQHLDPAEAPEQGRWLRQGITSLLVVPLREEREIVGVLGCETLGHVRHWGPRDRQLLETMADICQRVQGDDQIARRLAQANERAGDLAELLPEPVAVTDTDGVVVVWNPALADFSGMTADQACGGSGPEILETFLPGSGAWLGKQLQALPADKDPAVASNLIEVTDADGGHAWIKVSLRPLADGAGCLLHFGDVTTSKQEESRMRARTERLEQVMAHQQEELEHAQARLVETDKMAAVARMVTGLAHEIDMPVGVGLTAASQLASQADHLSHAYREGLMKRSSFEEFLDTARESSELINSNLQRASDLLSSMQRTAAGQTLEQRRQVQLKDYLGDVLLSLNPRLAEKHVSVRFSCPDDLDVVVEPDALSRIVSNLATNALEHAFDGMLVGEITVDASRSGDQVLLRIADDGCGIDAAQQPRIFEPFFTTAREGGGMGLGLHVVYNLVTRNLGGTLRCESRTGKGTVFEIMFPIDRDVDQDHRLASPRRA